MDAFETVIATLLERQGYWTRTSVKVDLTKEEKKLIGKPTSPRWEIDLIGFQGKTNTLRVVECKSYIDSPGVRLSSFDGSNNVHAHRFKIFNDEVLRETVFNRLSLQLVEAGFCERPPNIQLCLAAGNIYQDIEPIRKIFIKNGWLLWEPELIRKEIEALVKSGYDNSVIAVVTKILLRKK
jgi:hypothetical protein